MTEPKQSWGERAAEADAVRAEYQWGMQITPDVRDSPARLAWEAAQRGDRYFQIDLPIAYSQGNVAQSIIPQSRIVRPRLEPDQVDFIGQIEDQGWEFVQVSTTSVLQGEVSAGNLQTAYNSVLVGVYVFRRRAAG